MVRSGGVSVILRVLDFALVQDLLLLMQYEQSLTAIALCVS